MGCASPYSLEKMMSLLVWNDGGEEIAGHPDMVPPQTLT